MKPFALIMLCTFLFLGCNPSDPNISTEKWKQEIIDTEHAFAEMAKQEGIAKAFLTFADEDAVLQRNDQLIIGKDAIKSSFDQQQRGSGTASLSWDPDFVAVSSSGDLGYTYGKYTYTTSDSLGNAQSVEGIFHTVWKKQADGNWKFVFD